MRKSNHEAPFKRSRIQTNNCCFNMLVFSSNKLKPSLLLMTFILLFFAVSFCFASSGNFKGNQTQSYISGGAFNLFNDVYPEGGNYWGDYLGVDLHKGPNQDEPGPDGIGDTPYSFQGGQDRYTFIEQNRL